MKEKNEEYKLYEVLMEALNKYDFAEAFDEEVINWTWYPDTWEEDEYDNEIDAYKDFSNEEAEDVVIETFIKKFIEENKNLLGEESEATKIIVINPEDNSEKNLYDFVKDFSELY